MKSFFDTPPTPFFSAPFSYWGGNLDPHRESPVLGTCDNLDGKLVPLSKIACGRGVWVIEWYRTGGLWPLADIGLKAGEKVQVISRQNSGSVLLAMGDRHLGIGADVARQIWVSDRPLQQTSAEFDSRTSLREMEVGTFGCIVGYDQTRRGYQGKLLAMGLLPGTQFKILQAWRRGKETVLLLNNTPIELRQHEADALVVEEIN